LPDPAALPAMVDEAQLRAPLISSLLRNDGAHHSNGASVIANAAARTDQ